MANLMTNDTELKTNYNTPSVTKECSRISGSGVISNGEISSTERLAWKGLQSLGEKNIILFNTGMEYTKSDRRKWQGYECCPVSWKYEIN